MSSFAKLKPDALGELLATLEERDLLRLDCAFCNRLERPLYLEALACIDSGRLLKAHIHSKPKWERLFSWLCLRGVPAPKAFTLPRGADDDTMTLIVEQSETLANVQEVNAYNNEKCEIDWENDNLTSESLAAFARFSSLKELRLQFLSKLTDSSLRHIVELPIEKLDLCYCNGLLTAR